MISETEVALQKHLNRGLAHFNNGSEKPLVPTFCCKNGAVFSVQAGKHACCKPQVDFGAFTEVQVDYVQGGAPATWQKYRSHTRRYANVPIFEVVALIDSFGGLRGEIFEGSEMHSWNYCFV